MPSRRRLLLLPPALSVASFGARAQSDAAKFPTKPLRIIVPFSAGALTDIIARIYAEKLTPKLGQPVIVENRPGAGGVPASQNLLAQPADGHTLMFVSSGHAVNPALYSKLPYDTERDFSGLALLAASPSLVVVHADHPARTLGEFLALAKAKPGERSFGSAGVGSATHLVGEYFASEAKVKLLHVPYKGVQEAVAAVAGQQLDAAFPPIALAMPLMKSGRIRTLGVTSPKRVPTMPDTPTVAEQGLPGFDYSIWYALVARSGTPAAPMNQLAREIVEISAQPDVAEKLRSQGLIAMHETLADFDRFIASEMAKLGKLVKASGVTPQ